MNNQYLIQLSSNGLNSANNIQQQISQKKFEIKLVDLAMMNDYEKYYYMKCMKGQAESCIH